MTPSRTRGRTGNFEMQRVFPNVGEIRKSLGTSDRRQFNRRVALLEKLHKLERYDVLRAFRDDRISIEQLVEADLQDRLGSTLTDLRLSENLRTAFAATLPMLARKERTRQRYQVSFNALMAKGAAYLADDATVQELGTVPWSELWDEWGATAADWQNLKIALSSFLSRFLNDKWHPFIRAFRRDWPHQRVVTREPNISVADFLAIVSKAPEHAQRAYWVLAITGMRVGEYLACTWREHVDVRTKSILVPGTKTAGSAKSIQVSPRLWPYIEAGIPSPLGYRWLLEHWTRAVAAAEFDDVHLHDLRHCHGQWAIDAGVAESKVQRSLRHDDIKTTRLYTMRDATLEVSTALAVQLLGAEPAKGKEETA